MSANKLWRTWLIRILGVSVFAIILLIAGITRAGEEPVSMTTDWSDGHVMFSSPKSLLQSLLLARDPRYVRH